MGVCLVAGEVPAALLDCGLLIVVDSVTSLRPRPAFTHKASSVDRHPPTPSLSLHVLLQ